MKNNSLFLIMFIGVCTLFTSCVDGDMYNLYDEDGMEWFSPRRKGTKDYDPQAPLEGEYKFGRQWAYHRVITPLDGGFCWYRALNEKWSDWQQYIVPAVQAFVAAQPPKDQAGYISEFYSNGAVDVNKVLGTPDLPAGIVAAVVTLKGGNPNPKKLYMLKCCPHCVCIVGRPNLEETGGRTGCCLDMDGNIWDQSLLQPF